MSNLVQSIECMVEAGVKGIMGIAEGYLSPGSSNGELPTVDGEERHLHEIGANEEANGVGGTVPPPQQSKPVLIPSPPRPSVSQVSQAHTTGTSKLALPKQDSLLQLLDVPSGWIHLQSTYLDGDVGQKKVRSFGLKNIVSSEVEVEIESDLGGQLVFWLGEEEKSTSSSASSTSSSSTGAGSSSLHFSLPPTTVTSIFFAFQPTNSLPSTPAIVASPVEDGGYTPRVKPVLSRTHSSEMSPIVGPSTIVDDRSSEFSSISGGSSQSVAGSVKAPSVIGSSRRPEPVHRAFSVHGSITIRAITSSSITDSASPEPAVPIAQLPVSHQIVPLPFFATVCRSLFTAAPIDPVQGLVTGSQISSGELLIDFGGESVLGGRYHRDILLVNRSEIELIWKTTVVSSPYKDAVWFELRDLDSENVFGVDHSSQPVPLPALSSRHLRLELRVKAAVPEFDFTFLISNANQSGNVVTCRAVGSALSGSIDESLTLLSGTNLDFGQIVDGVWAKQMITCKNNGDKPIDVKFTAEKGSDVVFRLAGVAGEDMDEDIPLERERTRVNSLRTEKRGLEAGLSRTSTRDSRTRSDAQQPLRDPRAESPMSAIAGPSTVASRSRPSSIYSSEMSHAHRSVPGDFGRSWQPEQDASALSDQLSNSGRERERDSSRPPSRALSRVASRTSSHLLHTGEGSEDESEDNEPPFFSGGMELTQYQSQAQSLASLLGGPGLKVGSSEGSIPQGEQVIPNQIEEMTMRPGTEYRIFVLHRPPLDMSSPPETAGALRKSTFKVYLEYAPSISRSSSTPSKTKRTIHCSVESCTSLIRLPHGRTLDFGQVTVGASRSLPLIIENLSALSAKVEIAAISKVISANRNVIVIPPFEKVEEKLEFFPRRINEKYEKQMFVRNLLNRKDDQLVNIRSRNVDVYNLTLHSHLYRILTPSGSNFLDFGSVVINSPSIRIMHVENLSNSRLILELSASQPEDIELFVKAEDEPLARQKAIAEGKYPNADAGLERMTSPPNGELKERFMETLQELSEKSGGAIGIKKGKTREKSAGKAKKEGVEGESKSIIQQVAAALKKGGRGRPVQLYGNAVVFKDRALLEPHEYLDLAAGPPVSTHRSPRAKRFTLLDTIEQEDKTKLSGRHEKIPKLDFAAGAKATGSTGKEGKKKGKHSHQHGHSHAPSQVQSPSQADSGSHSTITSPKATTVPSTNQPSPLPSMHSPLQAAQNGVSRSGPEMKLNLATLASEVMQRIIPETGGRKSPALTAKRPAIPKPNAEATLPTTDPSKLSVDELLLAIEAHETKKSGMTHTSLDEEEAFVRRTIALRKELQNAISAGKLIPARTMCVEQRKTRGVVVVMTPNGSIRPHISTRAKRADSRIFIKLVEFDRSLLSESGRGAASINHDPSTAAETLGEGLSGVSTSAEKPTTPSLENNELPIRDLIIRSSCVRSVLEVQQSSINFGACDKGEVKEKTIVIHNKSDTIGLFRLRTSGSIASGDLKLGLGRYGVISAFGRKEVENFSFTPSLTGNYQETITVENVLDSWNDQSVSVKAVVRKVPAFKVEPSTLDFGIVDPASAASAASSATTKTDSKSKNKDGKDKVKNNNKTSSSWPSAQSFVVTNISKHDRTFVVTVNSLNPKSFAQLSLTRDEKDAGTALSKTEEEEVEAILQKLKIARRKGKAEKIQKYEARLAELGVLGEPEGEGEGEGDAAADPDADANVDRVGEATQRQDQGINAQADGNKGEADNNNSLTISRPITPGILTPKQESELQLAITPNATTTTDEPKAKACVTTLSLTLAPNQKTKILVDLVAKTPTTTTTTIGMAVPLAANSVGEISSPPPPPTASAPAAPDAASPESEDVNANITVHDKRNTDETVTLSVTAIKGDPNTISRLDQDKLVKMSDRAKGVTTDPVHLALMQHCLDLTLNCEVSPTAFCVGSTLFLPNSSSHYATLSQTGKFVLFPSPSPSTASSQTDSPSLETETEPKGLILGDGWSRQIPGNTHAEANALTNFRSRYAEVQAVFGGWGGSNDSHKHRHSQDVQGHQGQTSMGGEATSAKVGLPHVEDVLKDAECFATMEPCSIRTSGGPSCALELVRAGVRAVYLGVEEPPDFVQCEGVRILQDGGIKVLRTSGLEEACLKAARRGRN
ncbi:hypothetical protein IAT40_007430 [Kwoniella sp. CBS 6097]